MDEVENPDLPKAGESSPTIRPVDQDDGPDLLAPGKPPIDTAEAEDLIDSANPSPLSHQQQASGAAAAPSSRPPRPPLKRDNSATPPQNPPPAPPSEPNEYPSEPPDSLTLADLKRLRSTFPINAGNPEQQQSPAPREQVKDYGQVYGFEYRDAQALPVEVEEWYTYEAGEGGRLRGCRAGFEGRWRGGEAGEVGREGMSGRGDWLEVTEERRREFVRGLVAEVGKAEGEEKVEGLMVLVYLGLGVWEETAGRQEGCNLEDVFPDCGYGGSRLEEYKRSSLQVQWIVGMVDTLHQCGVLQVVYKALQEMCEESFASSPVEQQTRNEAQPKRGEESMGLWCCLTLMYLFIEVARTTGGANGKALMRDILALEPKLVNYLTQIVARLRWDDVAPVPLTKMLLLAWKTILVTFGGIAEIEQVKASLRDGEAEDKDPRGQPLITASPLDYHLFRQEISSKYPAYQPPAPLFPLEPETNSILPPLKHRRPSYATSETSFTSAPAVGTHSIMHQPVHIATPAPSPPPSPAGPGKAGKKQNYQTNQMFPFLYPPLDERSAELGGKGSTQLQDALVGRKWEGSDVPASILEAAELFAGRMRATRGMRQLWEARGEYMRFERGWKGGGGDDDVDEGEGDEDVDVDDFELMAKPANEETAPQGESLPQTEEQKKLAAVGEYYKDSLPHLQSVVIVLLKAVLQNVTDLVTKNNGQNGLQAGIQFNEQPNGLPNGSAKPAENGNPNHNPDGIENSAEELDKLRSQEIAGKALSGILLLLLKWFKVSHVLQYEYMTQLLLDSNYVPLILKLWQTQDLGRACHYRLEREESNFFSFCLKDSRHGFSSEETTAAVAVGGMPNGTAFDEDDSEDEAAPPPIRRNREDRPSDSASVAVSEDPLSPGSQGSASAATHPPEVDELGYPITPLPGSPLKSYSWRNVFASINYLRVLQKVTRRKTHRALLLVSYKSSNHLKKGLKVPIHALRYYTLKLFKTQVPFCGRKWRQGNMKIITAVWLSVPPDLRDDWLSGGGGGMGGQWIGDVDGTVEDALPLEQGVRELVHWWNLREFGEVMGGDAGGMGKVEEEWGFFERELERMGMEGEALGLGREEEGGMEMEGAMDGEGWRGPVEGY